MTTPDIRAALERLVELDKRVEDVTGIEIDNWVDAMDAARTALKAEPEGEGPSLEDINDLCAKFNFHLDDTQADSHGESLEILQQMICDALFRWWWRASAALETNSRVRDLQELLAKLLDSLCLPGHGVTEKDWRQACLLAGRYCEPFLSKSSAIEPVPKADPSHIDQLAAIIRTVDGNNSMGAAALAEAILERYPLAFLVDPPAAAPAPGENLATPPAPEPGEVGELAQWLHTHALNFCVLGRRDWAEQFTRAATLLQQQCAPPAPEPGEVGELLTNNGVFKGAHGIEGLLSADAFWEQQPYGTRLYYGDGNADYLHRDVLRSVATLLQRQEAELAALRGAPGPTFQDAIRLARGCHDYSGGHSGTEGEAWHGAIDLVVDVLKRAAVGAWDSQTRAVYGVGVEAAQAGEVEA
jgi:hypothetical protein